MLQKINTNSELFKVVKKILIININGNFKSIKNLNDSEYVSDLLHLNFKEFQDIINNFNTPSFYKKLNKVEIIQEFFKILEYNTLDLNKELLKFLFIKKSDCMDIIDRIVYIAYNELSYTIIDIILNDINYISNKKQLIDVIKNL